MTQTPLLAVMQGGEYRSLATHFQIYTEVLQHALEGGELGFSVCRKNVVLFAAIVPNLPAWP